MNTRSFWGREKTGGRKVVDWFPVVESFSVLGNTIYHAKGGQIALTGGKSVAKVYVLLSKGGGKYPKRGEGGAGRPRCEQGIFGKKK